MGSAGTAGTGTGLCRTMMVLVAGIAIGVQNRPSGSCGLACGLLSGVMNANVVQDAQMPVP